MRLILFSAGLLALLLQMAACSNTSTESKQESLPQLIQYTQEPGQMAFSDSLYQFRVEINYPIFQSNNEAAEKLLNDLVNKKIREYRGFEVEYRDNFDEMKASLGENARIGDNDLIVNYHIIDSCKQVIAFIFEVGTFYMGSAQSTFFQDCFSFDLRDMSRIYAGQIFNSTEDVLIPLTAMVNEKVRMMNENQCEGLSGPEELNHFINNFTMGSKGLTFHFSDFSICPFAGTDPSIFFTWDELRSLIKPEVFEKYCTGLS